jgi:LysR family glycine cleavage system transcriptional activator
MGRRLPPLNALRVFDVAARTGTFTRAADDLRVSQGAISRQIAHLEEFLGTKLFDRDGRQVKLTQIGRDYARIIARAFEQVEHETQRILPTGRRRSLRIQIFPSFAIRWLVPRLGSFHAAFPDIDVQITTSMQPTDLAYEDVDLTIERTRGRQVGSRYDLLFEIELLPVCNPKFLSGPDPIRHPKDVLDHVLLHALNRRSDWQRWLSAAGIEQTESAGGLEFGNSSLVYQAAANGVGIAIAQRRFVDLDLEVGRLVAPFDMALATGEIYYVVTRPNAPGAVVAFRDWLVSEATKNPGNKIDTPTVAMKRPKTKKRRSKRK